MWSISALSDIQAVYMQRVDTQLDLITNTAIILEWPWFSALRLEYENIFPPKHPQLIFIYVRHCGPTQVWMGHHLYHELRIMKLSLKNSVIIVPRSILTPLSDRHHRTPAKPWNNTACSTAILISTQSHRYTIVCELSHQTMYKFQ